MINKTVSYASILLIAVLVVITFITATNYTQLAIAALLYPPLAYFAFKYISRKPENQVPEQLVVAVKSGEGTDNRAVDIVDIDKRAFLKLIGAAGFSFFLFSLFTKKVESLILGRSVGQKSTLLEGESGNQASQVQSQSTNNYKISEIDNSDFTYYGFVNKNGEWYIMKEDPLNGSFRYSRGETNFPKSWPDREHLKYDYFHNVFN